MKKPYLLILPFIVLFVSQIINSQTKESISANQYQEVVYAHLNKSKFVKGEMLGFTAYVINKNTKQLSKVTKNLYAVLLNDKNEVVQSKLFKVDKGLVDGYFRILDDLQNGTYTFKTYTNWMRNFSQKNYYAQKIEIIDAARIFKSKKKIKSFYLDAQFLPESGHLLDNVINTVGVIIKDTLGLGIPDLEGKILDENNNFITSFKVNKNGIGRFSFIPNYLKSYKAVINNREKVVTQNIDAPIYKNGVILKVSRNAENAIISVITNESTKISEGYNLTFHDGIQLNKVVIDFENKTNFTKKIPFKKLSKGVNVFTLLDSNNTPIAERIFFNHTKVNILKSENAITKNERDSVKVIFQYAKRNINFNNVSISVLPSQTKAYSKNSNIVSQTLLQPYVKGYIENANYYFSDLNDKKLLDLDNLLITQGWSSYNWKDLFEEKSKPIYKFEDGISIKVNIPRAEEESKFLIHNLTNNPGLVLEFSEKVKSFKSTNYFPLDKELLYLSKVKRKGKLEMPNVYVQFSVNQIPKLFDNYKLPAQKPDYYESENYISFSNFEKLNKREELDEITLKFNLEKKRMDSIRGSSSGRVLFLNEANRAETLANYLNFKAPFVAYDDPRSGTLVIYNRRNDLRPDIYLDGFEVLSFDILYAFDLSLVEYINLEPESLMGLNGGGIIEIWTNPKKFKFQGKTTKEIEFPVTFSSSKEFYVPKYENYKSDFYKHYGVVDWLPINTINNDGILSLNINANQAKEVTLFIEGITDDGDFIMDQQTISLN